MGMSPVTWPSVVWLPFTGTVKPTLNVNTSCAPAVNVKLLGLTFTLGPWVFRR
jgi:hypothetical protein